MKLDFNKSSFLLSTRNCLIKLLISAIIIMPNELNIVANRRSFFFVG